MDTDTGGTPRHVNEQELILVKFCTKTLSRKTLSYLSEKQKRILTKRRLFKQKLSNPQNELESFSCSNAIIAFKFHRQEMMDEYDDVSIG